MHESFKIKGVGKTIILNQIEIRYLNDNLKKQTTELASSISSKLQCFFETGKSPGKKVK